MATIVNHGDGTATITWGQIEAATLDDAMLDALNQYVTLWMEERAKQSFQDRFKSLSQEDQAEVLAKFAGR
jgi:hypothetical protein